MHVTIGIITSGRPDGLLRLIGSLDQLTFSDEPPAIEILVVDNHPEQTSSACCRLTVLTHCAYEVESNQGIPHARNAVITLAKAETDFIVFIDDDQTADPHWLDALLKVQRDTKADVVTGPAIPQYQKAPRLGSPAAAASICTDSLPEPTSLCLHPQCDDKAIGLRPGPSSF